MTKKIDDSKIIGFIRIALVKTDNPGAPDLMYEFKNMQPYSIPTILRKIAFDIEQRILKKGSV